jgi:8-oxo-dGTP diphosphatase
VLLCHRRPDRQWYPDVWDLPGGHIQQGEQPEQALRRELDEELGVDVGTILGDPVQFRDDASGTHLTLWVVTEWQGTVKNHQPDEHDDIGWFDAATLRTLELADRRYVPLLEWIIATA